MYGKNLKSKNIFITPHSAGQFRVVPFEIIFNLKKNINLILAFKQSLGRGAFPKLHFSSDFRALYNKGRRKSSV